ncbi:MAG TPA: hypothetical protein VFR37_08235, partial [Longimicrobium sp.]|nr:hypothetical protein [Longimicrobium sp.]
AVASATGTNQVAFTGRAGNVLLKLAGDGVTATAGTAVNLVVSLNGDGAGPVPGARVHWTVLTGGGSVTPATSITERQFGPTIGQASAQWTLGAAAGPQTLRASVGPLQQTFTVNVIGLGTRTLVAQVPGRALDVSADRVLWVDSAGGTRVIKVRSRATGVDQAVKVDSQANVVPFTAGWLFPGGALVSGGAPARWVEWRSGALTELGSDVEQMSVHGSWAAWRTGSQVLRRNLATGVTDVVASSSAADVDAAPNGDVVYVSGGGVFLYDGTTTPVSTETPGAGYTPQRAATDGTNVVYRLFSFLGSSAILYLDQPGGDLLLAGATETHGGFLQFLLEGGWIAYRGSTVTAVGNVWRRSPAGVVEHLTTTGLLRGLAPDGTVVYELTPTQRYRLVAPGGTQVDVGIAASTDLVVARDGELYLLSGGSVFELGP